MKCDIYTGDSHIITKNQSRKEFLKDPYLETSWETNKIGTNTETGTTTSRRAHARNKDVEDGECGGGGEGNNNYLLCLERLLGDGVSGNSHHKTLHQILNDSFDKFLDIKHRAHNIYITIRKKCIKEFSWKSLKYDSHYIIIQ